MGACMREDRPMNETTATETNTGNRNTGNRNTGDHNTGDHNTGNYNTGYCNTGFYNTGFRNTGDQNTGHYNTGHYNTGYRNTGNYNTGDCNTGFFNTTTPETVQVFNNYQVDREAFMAALPVWLTCLPTTTWVETDDMSAEEKTANPTHETTGGFLKALSMHEAYAQAWADSDRNVAAVEAMPGFDRAVWIEITGLDLWTEQSSLEPCTPETIVVDGVTYTRTDSASGGTS